MLCSLSITISLAGVILPLPTLKWALRPLLPNLCLHRELGDVSSLTWRIHAVVSLHVQLCAAILILPFATCFALPSSPFPPLPQTRQQKFTGSDSPLLRAGQQKSQGDFQEGGGIYLFKVRKWFGRQRSQEVNGIQTFKSLMLMKTLHANSTLGKSAFSSSSSSFYLFISFFLTSRGVGFLVHREERSCTLLSLSWQSCLEMDNFLGKSLPFDKCLFF